MAKVVSFNMHCIHTQTGLMQWIEKEFLLLDNNVHYKWITPMTSFCSSLLSSWELSSRRTHLRHYSHRKFSSTNDKRDAVMKAFLAENRKDDCHTVGDTGLIIPSTQQKGKRTDLIWGTELQKNMLVTNLVAVLYYYIPACLNSKYRHVPVNQLSEIQ